MPPNWRIQSINLTLFGNGVHTIHIERRKSIRFRTSEIKKIVNLILKEEILSEVESSFDVLISRLKRGDEDAANQLVIQYEAEVRRFVRFRLSSPSIRRFVDSLDISQSVLGRFFVQYRQGHVEIESEAQLRNLLLTMARNKLYDHARKQRAAKRDARRIDANSGDALNEFADPRESPSDQLAASEIVSAVRGRLSQEDRYLVDQRFDGRSWDDLAEEVSSTPDAVRKRAARAIDRAARDLGVIE